MEIRKKRLMRMRRRKYCGKTELRADAETVRRAERINAVVRVSCLAVLLVMTRISTAAETIPAEETAAEKPVIRIVLRPEKEEGDPDPDLADAVRAQIREQVGDDPGLTDRLCSCVEWSYVYDDEVRPPGEMRGPGESDILLTFAEDPEYRFEGWTSADEDPDIAEDSEFAAEEPAGEEEADEYTDPEEFQETDEYADPEEFQETDEYADPEEFAETAEYTDPEEFAETDEYTDPDVFTEPDESGEWEDTMESGEESEADLRSFLTTHPREEEPAADEAERTDASEEPSAEAPEAGEGSAAEDGTAGGEDFPGQETSAEKEAQEFHAEYEPEKEFHIKDEGGEESVEEEAGIEQEVSVEYASDEKNTAPEKYEEAYTVPQELTESFTELIGGSEAETAEEAAEAEVQTQVQLIRTDSGNREEDLTDMYREALAGTDPERLDWETLLAPLPENDGMYLLRTTQTDETGKENVKEAAFSINRFGSVYTYNDAIQALRGNTVRSVERALVISEYNPDTVREESREVSLTLDGKKVGQVLYSVSRAGKETESRSGTEKSSVTEKDKSGKTVSGENSKEMKKWNRYDYVITPENFREDGVYSLTVSSRDTAGNTSEMHRYNGGGISFTVDGSPPELQAIQGLEKSVVAGRKADVRITAFDTVGLARLSAFVDGKLMAAEETFPDRHRAELAFSIPQGPAQRVRIVAEDTAGNVLDTDEKTTEKEYAFRPAFPFFRQITVAPPPVQTAPKPKGPVVILLLLIIGCSGASAIMLRRIFRREKNIRGAGRGRRMPIDG